MKHKTSQVILPAEILNSFQDLSKLKLIQSEITTDSGTITSKVLVSSYKLQLSDLGSLEIYIFFNLNIEHVSGPIYIQADSD